MTDLELYDNALIEINKLEAPSMLLEDYNYLINKAVQQYINKVYSRFETDQQSTDDLNFLRKTKVFEIEHDEFGTPGEDEFHYIRCPEDYLHILNCIITFENQNTDKSICAKKDKSKINVLCRRLTSDQYPSILMNAYFKPSHTRPYFFIREKFNDLDDDSDTYTEIVEDVHHKNTVIEFKTGSTKKYRPSEVWIDYLKIPEQIKLTEDIIEGYDQPHLLEFPDYVAYEVINEFVKLLLENTGDPRLQSNMAINQTIGLNKPTN